MSLAAALSGFDGVILFADTQETVGGYAKKSVEKLKMYDVKGHPFRFAIANATNEGNYADALESNIAAALLSITTYDLGVIHNSLTAELSDFYSKHVWPRPSDRPQMEYLLLIQPPTGDSQVFHIAETAVNPMTTAHGKSIGIGSYLADYILQRALMGGDADSLSRLIATAVYIAREVRENVDGCGEIHEILVFLRNGEWDYVDHSEILKIEQNTEQMRGALSKAFSLATDDWPEFLGDEEEGIEDILLRIKNGQAAWYEEWENDRAERKMYLPFIANRRAS